jgi:valyl-tRNA synthetase
MIMAGLEFTGKVPFRDIYIHGLVRDKNGRKMSKSLGNGLDPLELVDEFGSDAMKFTLAFMCAQGQDVLVDKDSFKMGSKFANKIWNASRYILMNLENREIIKEPKLLVIDRWIYSRLNSTAKSMKEAFFSYRYNDAAQASYNYFWNDFCDWYVEATKLSTKVDNGSQETSKEKDRAATVLLDVLSLSLKLLHPLLPFITEEIYQKLPNTEGMIINSKYPEYDEKLFFFSEEENFACLQSLVGMARTIRSECGITPDKKLRAVVRSDEKLQKLFTDNDSLIRLLAGIGELQIEKTQDARPSGSIAMAEAGFEVFILVAEAVDTASLKKKLTNDLERDKKYIEGLTAKLANKQFIKNAPAELVEEQRIKLEETRQRTEKFGRYLRDL